MNNKTRLLTALTAAALVLAALITYLVEKPCARWGSRKLEAWKARRRNDS